jgi:hypothetical protein
MRLISFGLAVLVLLSLAACSLPGGTLAITPTASASHCRDSVCVKDVIVRRADEGVLLVLFVVTDQDGKVSLSHPPQFTQDSLSVQAYQVASDQSEKLAFGQYLPSQEFICSVSNTTSWSKGQLSADCALFVTKGDLQVDVQVGDRLKVKLAEFNFEQAVEVTAQPMNSANNGRPATVDRTGGTRIVLAPTNCPGSNGAGAIADRFKQAAKIIWYRLEAVLMGGLQMQLAEPAMMLENCTLTIELSPLGDPTPFIQLVQQPGRFELIDSGSDYHAPGTVLRTTGIPSPTVPISPALQSAVPPKVYDVIATNDDLDLNQLMLVGGGGNSMGLEFGFQGPAAQKLAKVTTAHSISTKSNGPYYLCILLDSVVEACPSVQMSIINGRIVFGFNDSFEAQRLASILRNGLLPLDLKVIKIETIYAETTN